MIKPNQLKFPLRHDMGPTNFFRRWLARRVACNILNTQTESYQFGGTQGRKDDTYYLIDADKVQIAHWILTSHGYSCCCAEIRERMGIKGELK